MRLDKRIKELESVRVSDFDYSKLTDAELHFIVDIFKRAGNGVDSKSLDVSLMTEKEIEEYERIYKKGAVSL